MYLPFSKLSRLPSLANFEPFRKQLAHFYTLLNRLTNSKTYVDLFSNQAIATPVLPDTDKFNIDKNLVLTGINQIPNIPDTTAVFISGTTDTLNTGTDHMFVKGMPVIFRESGGTVNSLQDKSLYWIYDTPTSSTLRLSKNATSTPITVIGGTSGTFNLTFAQPFDKLNESSLQRINNTFPAPQPGALAYGDVDTNGNSTLYYYAASTAGTNTATGYRMAKLGWAGGNGYLNNNSTFISTFTGFPHGVGNYKIITSSNAIKIQFDYIEVVEYLTGARDIVQGVRTVPVTDYNVSIFATTAGINSIDNGIVIGNTGYWVYIVYNPESEKYGAVISLSKDFPFFPTDPDTGTQYRFFQRIGWVKTDATASFFPSLQVNNKFCFLAKPDATLTATFSGLGTSTPQSIVEITTTQGDLYPSPEYLQTVDMYLGFVGTGANNSNPRLIQYSIDGNTNFDNLYGFRSYGAVSNQVYPDFAIPDNHSTTLRILHTQNGVASTSVSTSGTTISTTLSTSTDITSLKTYIFGGEFNGGIYV